MNPEQLSPAPALEVEDVCFSYGENEVLHNISFSIPQHAFMVVVGPNGGGKTTLARILLGDLQPLYGSVKVFGSAPRAVRGRIGFVPQLSEFDPELPVTVLEAVMVGRVARRVFGAFSAQDKQAAIEALAKVGLSGFEKRQLSALSGGQRQRVFVAQALCAQPRLLLLDEPTANVDRHTERQLLELFSQLSRSITVVMVSHNLSVVAAHATHILCVNRTADIHELGSDTEAALEPLPGGTLAYIHNHNPEHVERLLEEMEHPHHAKVHD